LTPPPAPPPALIAPAPYEISFGRIAGTAPAGARVAVVRARGRVVVRRRLPSRHFDFFVSLPRGETTVRVSVGRRTFVVPHVVGLPRSARPRGSVPHVDRRLQRPIVSAVSGCTCAAYVRDLRTGAGAAWNARARFPAASTLKVAIAVEVLRRFGRTYDTLLRRMLVESDNEAANQLEVLLAGSTTSGGARVNALMQSLGLVDTEMFGGYLRETQGAGIPVRVERQPYFGRGKYTTAYDLAQLLAYVHLATEGKGRLRHVLGRAQARHLLYLLSRVGDRGKLGRALPGNTALLHKAGWISTARHDAGLVYHPRGVFVAVVMTYGVNAYADALAARVAATAFRSMR
jgi:beta-lactamase class A